jgi:hypothetical protein
METETTATIEQTEILVDSVEAEPQPPESPTNDDFALAKVNGQPRLLYLSNKPGLPVNVQKQMDARIKDFFVAFKKHNALVGDNPLYTALTSAQKGQPTTFEIRAKSYEEPREASLELIDFWHGADQETAFAALAEAQEAFAEAQELATTLNIDH